jgi:hypothetical protein
MKPRIDQWLAEAGGRAYVDEEGWEECARQLERELIATRTAFDKACYELRQFGAYAQTIELWEADIRTANTMEQRQGARQGGSHE